ncbi:MAG: conjugal transfer protein TraN [Sphingopyxis sp.]|uniref:conjugal transfer protein TraN n=1 Tax=Sphingopyxis sp. TaxID=1908224 RepID=UPI001A2EE7A6|nr:conjugal transfer protein TraN [Sphingopyxis sp.]MBJ7499655.1 conjugal transfer protein TraN [Sphingopyxis sp.]
MRRGALLSVLLTMLAVSPAAGQTTLDQAREEGRKLAEDARNDSALVPSEESQAEAVPGYAGTTLPQSSYFDDPDRLVSDAGAAAGSNESYRVVTDPDKLRPTFSNAEILATTARATAIESDPSTYLEGEDYQSAAGNCTPLPPGSSTAGYYEASCNSGSKVSQESASCTVTLDVTVPRDRVYTYYTGRMSTLPSDGGVYPARAAFDDEIAAGVCRETRAIDYCGNFGPFGYTPAPSCRSLGHTAYEVKCSEPAQGIGPGVYHSGIVLATGQYWLSYEEEAGEPAFTRNESACAVPASDGQCAVEREICVDNDPVTRVIDGVAVTQGCWAWSRSYQCNRIGHDNDCADLESNASCTYLREECLDEEPDGGPCKVTDRIYRCPVPGPSPSSDQQYICGDDVYCINGDCEPIVREASTEFKDALVALHALDQAGEEFDPDTLTVFSGERQTCHKPVFGLIDCCAGKVSGLLTVGAGAAALAGGPAAIAALATPLLTLFACSTEEKMLDIKDRMGFCHKVGTYCSSSFLGICSTRRTAYCCFESKLSRILQEQGRIQLGKPWGAPKREQCQGFSIDEFARLDLSKMDFTEVYAEFIDAARLPDEVETIADIQAKITNYYELHGAPGGP